NLPVPTKTDAPKIAKNLHQDSLKTSAAHAEPPAKLELQGTSPEGKMVWKMPSLEGLTAREALQVLQGNDLRVEIQGNGLIHTQAPGAGAIVTQGSVIQLRLKSDF